MEIYTHVNKYNVVKQQNHLYHIGWFIMFYQELQNTKIIKLVSISHIFMIH